MENNEKPLSGMEAGEMSVAIMVASLGEPPTTFEGLERFALKVWVAGYNHGADEMACNPDSFMEGL